MFATGMFATGMFATGLLAALALAGAGCDSAAPVASPSSSEGGPAPAGAASLPAVDVGPDAVRTIAVYTGGAKAGEAVPLVVAIHGLGDTPEAFSELFTGFPAKARFVFPAGGLAWGDGWAWWSIKGTIDEQNMAAGVESARKRVIGAIREWRKAPVAGQTIVTGFSQGGMLSFGLAARYPKEIGEAVPVSGMLPSPLAPAEWPAGEAKPTIVALHGEADARVPYALGKRSADTLRGFGLSVEWKSYPRIAHTITPDMRGDLFTALEAAVARQGAPPSP